MLPSALKTTSSLVSGLPSAPRIGLPALSRRIPSAPIVTSSLLSVGVALPAVSGLPRVDIEPSGLMTMSFSVSGLPSGPRIGLPSLSRRMPSAPTVMSSMVSGLPSAPTNPVPFMASVPSGLKTTSSLVSGLPSGPRIGLPYLSVTVPSALIIMSSRVRGLLRISAACSAAFSAISFA